MIIRSSRLRWLNPFWLNVHEGVVNGSFFFFWSTTFLFKIKAKIVKMKNKQEREITQKKEQQ